MHEDLEALADAVAAGDRERWSGEDLPRSEAKYIAPDVLYWIVAPRERHLDEIRGYLRTLYTGPGETFLHPTFPGLYDRGRQLWVWQDGVCGRYDFIVASGEAGLAGKGLRGAWIDEAGFVDNERFTVLKPALWEHCGRILATGTPRAGNTHWFTRMAVSGLPAGHERADPAIAEPDDECVTFLADTIHHAYLAEARRNAAIDAKFQGELWAAIWVWADWRMQARNVFREYRAGIHEVHYEKRRDWELAGTSLPSPDLVYGVVDWSGGTAPGASVVCHYWAQNHLDHRDPRPLLVVVEDYEGHDAYTDDGWWRILGMQERRWGVDYWIADPHNPVLIRQAKRAGLDVRPGPMQDKMGRINALAALLHHDRGENIRPALYISRECANLPRELSGYRWKITRGGEVTDKPKDHDDHCIDCLCMLVPEVTAARSVQIAGTVYS